MVWFMWLGDGTHSSYCLLSTYDLLLLVFKLFVLRSEEEDRFGPTYH